MTFLTRIDPTRNVDRFYVVQVMPSLFGDWTVLRECGAGAAPRATCGSAATSDAMKPRPRSIARSSAGCSGVTPLFELSAGLRIHHEGQLFACANLVAGPRKATPRTPRGQKHG
jgi:hypothetical protein